MTIEIPLTQGYTALIDDLDADLAELGWHAHMEGNKSRRAYACRSLPPIRGRKEALHRVVLERILGRRLEKGELVDHADNNSLNNCRGNLRLATYAQNAANRKPRERNPGQLRGTTWNKKASKWQASISFNKRCLYLGLYETVEEAHEAFKKKAIELRGEFVRLD